MIKRNSYYPIKEHLKKKEITLLIGARQVGKTTLLKEVDAQLKEEGKEVYFFTLEDPLFLNNLNQHPENIFNYIPKKPEIIYLLLDEIQILENPTNFLKYLFDVYSEHLKLVVTGSSAFYIDKKFKDSLAGRKRIFEIYPFSFSEFLLTKGEPKLAKKVALNNFFARKSRIEFLNPEKLKLEQFLIEYFKYGGYPKVVLEDNVDDKVAYLKELHMSFLKKDIYEEGIKEEIKFYQLIMLLSSQTGQLVNNNELSNSIGVSNDTITKYLYVMQKSFIIRLCPPFFRNIRKELTKMPKVYFIDNGFRNSLLKMFKPLDQRIDGGQSLENLICSELIKSDIEDIRYWRTQDKREVDFVVNENFAFEIKLNANLIKKTKVKHFLESYPEIPLHFVTYINYEHLNVTDFFS